MKCLLLNRSNPVHSSTDDLCNLFCAEEVGKRHNSKVVSESRRDFALRNGRGFSSSFRIERGKGGRERERVDWLVSGSSSGMTAPAFALLSSCVISNELWQERITWRDLMASCEVIIQMLLSNCEDSYGWSKKWRISWSSRGSTDCHQRSPVKKTQYTMQCKVTVRRFYGINEERNNQ